MSRLRKIDIHLNQWAIIYVLLSYVLSSALLINFYGMKTDWCSTLMFGCGVFWLAVMLIADKVSNRKQP